MSNCCRKFNVRRCRNIRALAASESIYILYSRCGIVKLRQSRCARFARTHVSLTRRFVNKLLRLHGLTSVAFPVLQPCNWRVSWKLLAWSIAWNIVIKNVVSHRTGKVCNTNMEIARGIAQAQLILTRQCALKLVTHFFHIKDFARCECL